MDKYKKFLPYAVSLFLMFFNFLFFSLPYFNNSFFVQSGYDCLDLWGFGWSGVLLSVLQLFTLLVMISIIIIATVGLFIEFARLVEVNKNIYLNKTNIIVVIANLCLDAIVFIFLVVFIGVQKFTLSAGLFLKIFFDIAGLILLLIIEYKYINRAKEIFKPIEDKAEEAPMAKIILDSHDSNMTNDIIDIHES